MRWRHLALRSAAALLVGPSSLAFAHVYLPMGTFDSDTQLPTQISDPQHPDPQKLPSFDSAAAGAGHLASSDWRRGIAKSGSGSKESVSVSYSNHGVLGGYQSGEREEACEGQRSNAAIAHLKQWLKGPEDREQLMTPLLKSEGPSPSKFCNSCEDPSMTAGHSNPSTSRNALTDRNDRRAESPAIHQRADSHSNQTARAPPIDNEGPKQLSSNVMSEEPKGPDKSGDPESLQKLRLNVLMLVIGTRGDVQPMAALGRVLQEQYGHHVRLATHAPFKDFVESQGLEFFPMPGNPNFLIDQMVTSSTSTRWSLPSSPSGIFNVRRWFKGIIFSQWPACTAPSPSTAHQTVPSQTAQQPQAPHWPLNVASAESVQNLGPIAEDGERTSSRQQTSESPEFERGSRLTPAGASNDPSFRSKDGRRMKTGTDTEPLGETPDFFPDLIVATPTTQVALSCAQRLGVPLHVFYLMPYSRTRHIPHPLSGAPLPGPNGGWGTRFTWSLIESVAATGVWDYVNRFRKQVLGLPLLPRGVLSEFFLLEKLGVPTTYAFSPDLVPKPKDWGDHIRIVNYVYDDSLTSRYAPSPLLQRFLDAGDPPVYIGFGSMKLDDTEEVMDTIVTAVKAAGVRAVIHKRGWADDVDELQQRLATFGTARRRKSTDARRERTASLDSTDGGSSRERRASGSFVSNDILVYEEEVPHGWLFARCQAVVTHGGAGTVGAALRAGKPVMVVPFWGDQFLWGQLVAAAGVGPEAVPVRKLTEESLAEGLLAMGEGDMVRTAAAIGERIRRSENGVDMAASHIQSALPLEALRCDPCGERAARTWDCNRLQKICPQCLREFSRESFKPPEVLPYRTLEWRLSLPRGDCCGLFPEKVFTVEQMQEAKWRSSMKVERVVGDFRWPQHDEKMAEKDRRGGEGPDGQ